MDRKLEERLQDYLDGRMSADERARFEERLEGDADLAALVRADVESGNALRSGEDELSPGFYTRTRARFEESVRPKGRRWFRLLSWETAGLTATVLLVGALFVPAIFRGELSRQDLGAVPEAPKATEAEGAAVAGDEAVNEAMESRDKDEAVADHAPSPAKMKRMRKEEPQIAPTPEPLPTQPARPATEELAEDDGYAPAPPDARRQTEKKGERSSAMTGAGESARRDESLTLMKAQFEMIQGIPLPAGVVEPGGVRRVENREAWDALRLEAGEGLAGLGPFDPNWRLVLIGPRAAPFNCEWVQFRKAGEVYLVTLSRPEGDTDPAPHGCAVSLPRDGRGVVVEPFPPVE